jgi:hypothetical protein
MNGGAMPQVASYRVTSKTPIIDRSDFPRASTASDGADLLDGAAGGCGFRTRIIGCGAWLRRILDDRDDPQLVGLLNHHLANLHLAMGSPSMPMVCCERFIY